MNKKGIVYTETGVVRYKFDTPGYPILQPGEFIKERGDADNIQPGAIYDSGTETYSNPMITAPKDFKALFTAAITPADKIQVIADMLGLL